MKRLRTLTQRERLRKSLYPYYALTANLRALPNAIIIGGMKCGTTTMNAWLREHPKVAFSSVKEIHYFDKYYSKGPKWYRTHFPIWEAIRGATCRIESTPSYLAEANTTAERMHELIPEAKLIAMLRNPVERAISHYYHLVRNGIENRPPEIALTSELARSGRKPNPYKTRGLYAQQLGEFLRHYDPSRVLVIKSEDFFTNEEEVFKETQKFLNLKPIPLPKYSPPRNINKTKSIIPESAIEHLRLFYEQPNKELRQLIPGFGEW